MADSSAQNVLAEINNRANARALAPFMAAATIAAGVVSLSISASFALLIWTIGSAFAWMVHRGDRIQRTTPLFFELDSEAADRYTIMGDALETLATAKRIWRVSAPGAAGAAAIARQPVQVRQGNPPNIATNVHVWGIDAGRLRLFFFPDRAILLEDGKYRPASYDDLRIECERIRVVDDGDVPSDAQVVGSAWQHANRDGEPDRRFRHNKQIPVAQYAALKISGKISEKPSEKLSGDDGFELALHVSSVSQAEKFCALLKRSCDGDAAPETQREETSSHKRRTPVLDDEQKMAFQTLGLSPNATAEDVSAAFKRMALMYHPDKVVGLAPEFRQLAELRMKEINSAYQTARRVAA